MPVLEPTTAALDVPYHPFDITTENWKDWSVIDYVTEEVKRQGHDTSKPEGMQRVAWMLEAWVWMENVGRRPGIQDVLTLGAMVEREKNACGFRTGGVVIKDSVSGLVVKTFPTADQVPRLLEILFEQRDALDPLEFYRRFEDIHPFIDGNGRVGKIILNALMGTLLAPVFPPRDLFGEPIRNP